jgi:hypothetical protein
MPTTNPLLAALGERLRMQDNRATSHPIFLVEQKRRIYGLDSRFTETFEWTDSSGEAVEAELARVLEIAQRAAGLEPDGYQRVGYVEIFEFVTACLSEEGANAYLRANRHNLREPRIYVASGYRNDEWIDLRAALMDALPLPLEKEG